MKHMLIAAALTLSLSGAVMAQGNSVCAKKASVECKGKEKSEHGKCLAEAKKKCASEHSKERQSKAEGAKAGKGPKQTKGETNGKKKK